MKCVASYIGKVNCVLPDGNLRVSVWRQYSKNREEIVADMVKAKAQALAVGDVFTCKVMKRGKKYYTEVKKLKPKVISPRTLARICNEVNRRLGKIDF